MKMRNHLALFYFFPLSSKPTRSFLCHCSSLANSTNSISNPNLAFVDCLMNTYKFTRTQALSISNGFSSVKTKSPDKPQSVHKYFRELGFSETQIRTVVLGFPQILFSYANRTLKPKVEFFKQLGVDSSDLGKLFSKNPYLLKHALNKKMMPSIKILKEIFGANHNNKDFVGILGRCRLLTTPERLLANCAFLESCRIFGPQLSFLLKKEPSIFSMAETKLRELVSRVSDMGLSLDSKMFLEGLITVNRMRNETIKEKLDLLGSLGFSESECMEMFRKFPGFLETSKEKLKFGIEFYLNTIEFKRSVLIRAPVLLKFSMKKRVIPRYKVLQVLKLKRLLGRRLSFRQILIYSDADFLERFVLRYRDDVEELLVAYKGDISVSSDEEES